MKSIFAERLQLLRPIAANVDWIQRRFEESFATNAAAFKAQRRARRGL